MLWSTLRKLKSADPSFRLQVVTALGKRKTKRVAKHLVVALHDSSYKVAEAAAMVLARTGPPAP